MTEQTMNRLKRSKGHRLDRQCFGRDIGSKQELICKLLRNVGGQAMRVQHKTAKLFAIAISLLLPAGLPFTAKADLSGNYLLTSRQSKDNQDLMFCTAFIVGAVDALKYAQAIGGIRCLFELPEESTGGQWEDITKKWLIDRPEKRHVSASALVIIAMADQQSWG
jgi:hypothetical protein